MGKYLLFAPTLRHIVGTTPRRPEFSLTKLTSTLQIPGNIVYKNYIDYTMTLRHRVGKRFEKAMSWGHRGVEVTFWHNSLGSSPPQTSCVPNAPWFSCTELALQGIVCYAQERSARGSSLYKF